MELLAESCSLPLHLHQRERYYYWSLIFYFGFPERLQFHRVGRWGGGSEEARKEACR